MSSGAFSSKFITVAVVLALAASACAADSETGSAASTSEASSAATSAATTAAPSSNGTPGSQTASESDQSAQSAQFPSIPDGPLDPAVVDDLDLIFADLRSGFDFEAVRRLGRSGDPRVAWLLTDLLRFLPFGDSGAVLGSAFEGLTSSRLEPGDPWGSATNLLIALDVPAPPGYVQWKRRPFEIIESSWKPFFDDEEATIDWRYVSWGGVLIDDRPISTTFQPCPDGCIAAMTEPPVTDAAGGDWYGDDSIVFGIVLNGEARAYPKNQMEVHEMVNDVLGGRRIAVPYCTLCGSAQAYLTDEVEAVNGLDIGVDAGRYELRTSGLLTRSNKLMYEYQTFSAFDTFTGVAVSGPLRAAGVVLPEITVETARWGAWKAEHPDTTILAETGVRGEPYPSDPLDGRDNDGPIFPIGSVDDRLDVQAPILGIVLEDGTPIAFEVSRVQAALDAGEAVEFAGVRVIRSGGLRAELLDGTPVVSHQAFWFAWSQFHDTLLWTRSQSEPAG